MAAHVAHGSLLEQLYGAASSRVRWETFLRALAERFHGDGAVLVDVEKGRQLAHLSAGFGIGSAALERALELAPEDILTRKTQHCETGEPVACRMILSDEEVHDSPLYRELMAPAGLEYRLKINSSKSERHFRCTTVMRSLRAGPFDDADVQRASRLAPHIDRAIDLYSSLSRLASERAAALSTLDDFGIGIALADENGAIRFLNREARVILALDDGLTLEGEYLQCGDPVADRRLRDNIRLVCNVFSAEGIEQGRPVRVERKSGATPFAVFVIAARDSEGIAERSGAEKVFATVLISNPQRQLALSQAALRNLYGITPAEARVLWGILAGATVTELSEELHITAGTVRAHLKGIFKATRTRGQADLVRRVMLDAGWMRTPPSPEC